VAGHAALNTMTRKAAAYFAQSYAEARRKFVDAATAAGIEPVAYAHPLIGHDGETLAMDVARFGPAEAPAVLIISSACHGAEGFCGSGVQNALLADAGFQAAAARGGVALLYVHALNPYGFSWWRRSTHENVDLNRNFQDFSKPLPHNAAYDRLAHLLVPAEWPPTPEVKAALAAYLAEHGAKGMQAAVSAGQYEHPQGLFYGGRNPTWSQQTLRHVLQDHGRRCSRMGWIDLHTGLGPSGHGERIFAGPDDAAALARARSWWGEAVTSMYDGSSESALLTGLMWLAAWQECPQAEVTGIALEYGTLPFDQVIDALRADQWLENHPEAPHGMRVQIKRQMRDAFYVDTEAWKSRVLEQGIEAAHQAVAGLTG
jgi:Protein of unknown function (DUF2817)